jgi:methylamine---glutamate N-methyltransferase subunit B
VKSLGADCIEKPLREHHRGELRRLLDVARVDGVELGAFRRYGSARKLYNFHIDNVGAY